MLCPACGGDAALGPHAAWPVGLPGALSGPLGRRRVRAGGTLYVQGDPFEFLYGVRCGALKSTMTLPDGREQVSDFPMSGDILGLDAMADATHASTAVALEDTVVCALPYGPSQAAIVHPANVHRQVSRLMSAEITRAHRMMLLLSTATAQERLAYFLLDQSRRWHSAGYGALELTLRMSRADIGKFLGLTVETVSRTFSTLQGLGQLQVDRRRVRIADLTDFSRRYDALLSVG